MSISAVNHLWRRLGRFLGRPLRKAKRMAAPTAILAGGLGFLGATADVSAVELIQNGSFEMNDGFNGNNAGFSWLNDAGVPIFDVYDHASQVYYEGPAPAGAGNWYFHTVGLGTGGAAEVYQDVDLTAAASINEIDAGTVAFNLNAWLAGWTASDDHPDLALQFRDGAGNDIGSPVRVDGADFGPGSGFVGTADGSDLGTFTNPIAAWKEYEVIQGVAIGARSARLTILQDTLTGNGNDNYIDLVSLDVADTGVEQFMKLQVNTASGAVTMTNGTTDAVAINYYEVHSAAGSLSTAGWNSFADQGLDSLGSLPEQNWTEGGGSDSELLVEAFPLGSTSFNAGDGVRALGQAFDTSVGVQDLEFYYAGQSGQLLRGIVEYVEPPNNCDFNASGGCDVLDLDLLIAEIVAGGNDMAFDLNGDGMVTVDDVTDAAVGWLATAGGQNLGPGRSYLVGDANLDGNVDGQDFIIWNADKFSSTGLWSQGDFNADGNTDGQDFILWNANKFTSGDGIDAVPEPAGWVGFLLGIGLASRWRR